MTTSTADRDDRMSEDEEGRHLVAARRALLASRILQARRASGLTQRRVADLAGFDRSYYGEVERGTVGLSVDRLWRLAGALDVHPGDLLRS